MKTKKNSTNLMKVEKTRERKERIRVKRIREKKTNSLY